MSTVNVKVSKFTVQYMLKDTSNDLPKMLPRRMFSVTMNMGVPDELAPYIDLYVAGFSSDTESEDRIVPEYNAPKAVINKWRKDLQEKYPDTIREDLAGDSVIDLAIGLKLEDAIEETLDSMWESGLSERLSADPDVPDGYRLAGRYINLIEWSVLA